MPNVFVEPQEAEAAGSSPVGRPGAPSQRQKTPDHWITGGRPKGLVSDPVVRLATAALLASCMTGCSTARVDARVGYWQEMANTALKPGTQLAQAQAFFATQGLELSCCTNGPDIHDAYMALERNVGRHFLIEYDVAVIVDVSNDQKIERVRVQRWGVGL